MKKTLFTVLICGIMVLTLTGCGSKNDDVNNVSIDELNDINNKIIFYFNDTATTEIYTLSLHDALPIYVPLSLK